MPKPRHNLASSREYEQTIQPLVMGRRGAVAAGHFTATACGHRLLEQGGNAIDAGVGASIALNVLLFDRTSFSGVAPIMIYDADKHSVVTFDGLGVWPALARLEYFQEHHQGHLPVGILRSVTPGAPDAYLSALAHHGRLTLGEVLEPAYELAHDGAAISAGVAQGLKALAHRYDELDGEAQRIFFPGGSVPEAGQVLVQEDLAHTFKALMDEESRARKEGASRTEGIMKARDLFYQGWIAERVAEYHQAHGSWMRYSDLAAHKVDVSPALSTNYHGYDVYTCGPWCQGPLLIQFLNILETFDLDIMEHNGSQYLHTILEAMHLALADRENYYGDPRCVEVPLDGLLSKAYAQQQAKRIIPERACGEMPLPGNPWPFQGENDRQVEPIDIERYIAPGEMGRDTSYVAAGDQWGNMFSATPSDPVFDTPIIPGLGFSCSGRGSSSRIHPNHPSALAPGKRPRLTPNPAMVLLEGRPLLAFGCPGGDIQTQGMLQFFLNLVHQGCNLQAAVERPRVMSYNYPSTFAPFTYHPGRVEVEGRISSQTCTILEALGHDVRVIEDYAMSASSVHAVAINPMNGTWLAAADPRREGAAWAR